MRLAAQLEHVAEQRVDVHLEDALFAVTGAERGAARHEDGAHLRDRVIVAVRPFEPSFWPTPRSLRVWALWLGTELSGKPWHKYFIRIVYFRMKYFRSFLKKQQVIRSKFKLQNKPQSSRFRGRWGGRARDGCACSANDRGCRRAWRRSREGSRAASVGSPATGSHCARRRSGSVSSRLPADPWLRRRRSHRWRYCDRCSPCRGPQWSQCSP